MFINSLISDNLQQTIIRHPLIVSSKIMLPDVIALLNEASGNHDSLPIKDNNSLTNSSKDIASNTSQATSCVLVIENSRLVGIITQRDLIKLTAQGKNLEGISVAQVMTRELITLKLRDFKDVFTALHLLRQNRICHLPIIGDRGELIGLVTPTSLLAVSILQAELYNHTRVKLVERQKIEAELRLERNFVATVLNLADALVIVLDFQGKIVRFNHTCEQATGYTFDEVKGRFVWDVLLLPEITQCIKDIFKNLADKEFPQRYETSLVTKDSDRRLISWSNKVLPNRDNQVDYIVCTGIDITESRKAQEELQQTRNFLQSMINNLPVAVFVKDAKPESFGTVKLWNHTCENIFGITAEQAIGKTDYEFFPKEQADLFCQKDLESFASGLPQDISEEPIDSPSFGRRILHTTKIPLYDKNQQPEYLLCISEDITEYKRAEKNLQQAKEQLQTVLDAVPGFVSWVNDDGYYLGVNRHLAESFNLTPDAFVGQELGFMENSPQFTEFMQEFLNRQDVADSKVIDVKINSKTCNYLLVAQKYQQNTAAVAIGIDITKRKQAEIALQSLIESTASTTGRDFFPALVEHISSTLDVRNTLVSELVDGQAHTLGFWSDGQLQLNICYDPKSTLCEILLKQGFYHCSSGIQQFFPNAKRLAAMEAESSMGVILSDDFGQPIGSLCIVDDKPIPDQHKFEGILKVFAARASAELQRQRAQEALQKLNQDLEVRVKQRTLDLQQSEAELRAIFNQAAVGIKLETLDGHFLKANQKLCEILGYSQEEILKKNFRDITHPEDIEIHLNHLQKLIVGEVETFSIEKRYLHKNADVIWINLTVSLIRDPIGKPIYVIGVVKDIRERKQAEENICKALVKEKELSELKSRFISMTSHEFRTPLAVIASSAGILKSFSHKLDEQQKHKHLQCIQTYVQHTTQLLDDILLINKAEAGKLAFEPTYINLINFCCSLVEEIQLSSPKHTLAFSPQYLGNSSTHDRFMACIDKKLLRQILSNLLSNAVKYSPDGSNVQIDLLVQDKSAVFLIQDEGIGILPEDQQKLFEPFYRASNVGNMPGTGLGLAIVNNCIDLHRGRITFASQVRVGTTFRVELPLIISDFLNEKSLMCY
ncbi:PAS domain S-box protein [Nostoc sp. 'Lobaria pulmonaria (5183) cyanobiont']|uniref:PAS domain S-box protein n=1 Tax=Nostoc sp. 'Lobaria pulmonaria (5183) cyanobiont' TaxID=1618022 RepID=UPI000CF30061|nr:PAS domain S-box protein [Nostoc sp. 'Lobaria pulmonaria (5183) cyanobiont']AVH68995.1 multi-sensor signal transduction histidine kinase [Nostoc sp. 'Lobaria pulmonaria (5183) cyanobiont']